MSWEVCLAKRAEAFLKKNRIPKERVGSLVRSAIRKFQGERVSIDVKKLRGEWSGFFRIRKGELRIIIAFDFDARTVFVEAIDWRGSIY